MACSGAPGAGAANFLKAAPYQMPILRQAFDLTFSVSEWCHGVYLTHFKYPHMPNIPQWLLAIAFSVQAAWNTGGFSAIVTTVLR